MKKLYGFIEILVGLMLLVYLVASAVSGQQDSRPIRFDDYVGDAKCVACHEDKKRFWETAHHLTSRQPTKDSIAGNFGEGQNILKTSDPELNYRMEAKADGFYQTVVLGTPPDTASISKRFDIVLGSGRKGQTYLYWSGDQLLELPVSYWTELGKWVNSPGYEDGSLDFSRPVTPRCLECHASFFESISDSNLVNRYNKSKYILGISCERCHGPGREHVALQVAKSASPSGPKPPGQAIVTLTKLSRERQVALCALCHGGIGVEKAPPFSFIAGKDLENYIHLTVPALKEVVDVHGNQVALLERSRCFRSSTMTCSTCHNLHLTQRDLAGFSERCLDCHKIQSCGLYAKRGQAIAGKCVACHMPKETSRKIVSSSSGADLRPQVRTHWIKIYPEISPP